MDPQILITGGTGRLGKVLSHLLAGRGVPHTLASRKRPEGAGNWKMLDLESGEGLQTALTGVSTLYHLAHHLEKDDLLTDKLLAGLRGRGIHLVYISIVGIDRVPFAYYGRKLASEGLIAASGEPYSILRATQFHEFADWIIASRTQGPVAFLPPKALIQPVKLETVANRLLEIGSGAPLMGIREIGGPEVLGFVEMAKLRMEAVGRKIPVVPVPCWGAYLSSLAAGGLTTTSKDAPGNGYREWLDETHGHR